jgi:hypothetical protein
MIDFYLVTSDAVVYGVHKQVIWNSSAFLRPFLEECPQALHLDAFTGIELLPVLMDLFEGADVMTEVYNKLDPIVAQVLYASALVVSLKLQVPATVDAFTMRMQKFSCNYTDSCFGNVGSVLLELIDNSTFKDYASVLAVRLSLLDGDAR